MAIQARQIALVTGAAGGVGLAVSRALGLTMDVVITDLRADRLEQARASLEADGVGVVAAIAGGIQDPTTIAALFHALPNGRSLQVLVHAAGQSPVQGDWQSSIMTNVVGTRRLLTAAQPRMAEGGAAVLVSSLAGHAAVPLGPVDEIIEEWESPDLISRLAPHLETLDAERRAGRCYVAAKRMLIQLAATLSVDWASRGVRIMSVSPGLVDTLMGRAEVQDSLESRDLANMIPLQRMAKANDIAAAVAFLVSPSACYITGCDLRIDGGLQAALELANP